MVATIYGAADRAYAFVPVAVQTANYTAAQNQLVPVDTSAAARTITLPTAPPDQTVVCVKKVAGSNNVTVATGAGDVFNVAGGPTTWTLALVGQAIIAQYSAAAAIWYIFGDAGNGTVTGNFSASGNGSFGGTLNVTGKTTFADQISINSSDSSGSIFINQSVNTSSNPGTISQQESASTSSAYAVFVSGDGHARFVLGADGTMRWGPGNASLDSTLARTSAGMLSLGAAALIVNEARPEDHSLITWAFDPYSASGSGAPSAGVLHLIKCEVRAAATANFVWVAVPSLGTALTSGQNFVAVLDSSGNRLAVSADQSVNWATGSGAGVTQKIALTSSAALTTPFVWVAILVNGTGLPSFGRGSTLSSSLYNANLSASTARWATNGSALTSVPASITPSSNSNEANSWWAALST